MIVKRCSGVRLSTYNDREPWRIENMTRFLTGIAALTFAVTILVAQNRSAPNIEFVAIQAGEFMMGCSADDTQCNADEKPAHRVQITKSFEMGKFEVTQAQWQAVMGSNPSAMKGDDRPVETVSKDDAHEFLGRLNARNDGYRYRLPTEAEWEYAARAGTTGTFAGKLDDIAWYGGNSEDETHPVGKKKPNAWGLYDMEGNVREWVEDLYNANYYATSPAADPTGPAAGQFGGPGGPGGPDGRGGPPRGFRGGRGPRGRGFPPPFGGPDGPPDGLGPPPPPPPPEGVAPPDGFGDPPPRGFGGFRGGPDGRGGPGGPRGGGGRGQLPIMRGGGWDNLAGFLRVSSRYNYYGPTLRVSDVGFRIVRERVTQPER